VALTLDEGARLAGGYRWAEASLFSVLGGWVVSTPEIPVKLTLDRHSQHHAWRAQQWWDRLPALVEVDRESLVVPLWSGLGAVMDSLPGLEGTVPRLAAAYRVALPRLATAYESHLSRASAAADGSTVRTLQIVGRDLADDWREGELLLQSLIPDGPSIRRAAETVARLEEALLSGRPEG
jgi:hypothetical protein